VVESALRYRAQVPLIESLLKEVGLKGGGSLNDFTHGLHEAFQTKDIARPAEKPAEPVPAVPHDEVLPDGFGDDD